MACFGIFIISLMTSLVTCQMVHQQTTADLQQCVANLACSFDYKSEFQAKLDNATRHLELELELLRHQTGSLVAPLQNEIRQLQANQSNEITYANQVLGRVLAEQAYDREYLRNITQGLYILNNDFHRENLIRYQDVHRLVLELNEARSNISTLGALVEALITASANSTLIAQIAAIQGGVSGGAHTGVVCTAKDSEILELRSNLTYFMNAYASEQKLIEMIRNRETMLQSEVERLQSNLSQALSVNHIKDNLIINLQNQLKAALANAPASLPAPGTCVSALGMQSGAIPNSALSASAYQPGYGPEKSRLNDSTGWFTPERATSQDFLQIDTGSQHYITKVATQGGICCDVMVTNYTLSYSNDGVHWKEYTKDCVKQFLTGNSDQSTVVEHTLDTPIIARYIRFHVVDYRKTGASNYVGMRVELYGCAKN
ncbi:uncharacterized protein LOC127850665 [Dreissena polymorpha]|uniref:F5/8 type C domain-containing protein n=1 Tax=Dreissena polymorpha TaxID=45954 RepID=A0A9D4CW99_DREPO|nr:uncharacterized protein LOC127850665 [Dreissena polymorpha]KAH3734492.1 hypothetical protein DPMN_040931 [Dreissena polymorpha]